MSTTHQEPTEKVEDRPQRIQRKRTKGWRTPPNTVFVGRPTEWGNPHDWTKCPNGKAEAVALFEQHQLGRQSFRLSVRHHLAGKNLACWCGLDEPCHADLLLRIANDGLKECHECGQELPPDQFDNGHWRCRFCQSYRDTFGPENMFDSYNRPSECNDYPYH